jgi:hypothetical protein
MGNLSWSAPVGKLNGPSISPAVAAALTDISPAEVEVPGDSLVIGSRVLLFAQGEFTTTSVTPTCVLAFYIANIGTAIGSAVLLGATGANAGLAAGTAVPWKLAWRGRLIAVSGPADANNGSIYGQGDVYWPASLTAWAANLGPGPFPQTAAARTSVQTANGLNTLQPQKVMVASTWSTITGVTSMTCQELTCEVIG